MTKQHHNVELAVDFFFVNGRSFLDTKSRKIYFRSVQASSSRGKYRTISGLKQVKIKYKDRDFTITNFHGDNEFEHLHNFKASTHLHK